ncbi:MAG: tetratricopeptide repeat protein [Steroidobacteraceae bacterium]
MARRGFRRGALGLIGAAALAVTSAGADGPSTPATVPAAPTGEFKRLIALKEYPQAVAEANRLLAAAEVEPGDGGEYLQVALMNLALAEYLNLDYVQAETHYLRVIELIESSGQRNDARLARAQAGLANTYYAGKRYDLAVARYEQAIALVRRNQGLFSEEQVPYLRKFADALTQLNRNPDALRVHRYLLKSVGRRYGEKSLQYASELEDTGRWLSAVGAYDQSRTALNRAISIIEDLQGENAGALIGPLTALGECARRQLLDPSSDLPQTPDEARRTYFVDPTAPAAPEVSVSTVTAEGQRALERAVAVAGAQSPQSALQVADTRTLLGDWYQSRRQFARALDSYLLAWRAAEGAEMDGKPVGELIFGQPVLLVYRPPFGWNRYADPAGARAVLREVHLELVVGARGTVDSIKVTDDSGDPDRAERATDAAEDAIYRPRFAGGAPVATTGVTLVQPFYVREQDLPDAAPAAPASTPPAATPAPAPVPDATPDPVPESPPPGSG